MLESRGKKARVSATSIVVGFVLLIYVLLVTFRVTSSSLSLNFESADVSNSAQILIGEPRSIRGDEWLRWTPSQIGQLHSGWTKENLTPFEYRTPTFTNIGSRLIEAVVFPDRTIPRFLGERGFAVAWWFPVVMGFLTTFFFMLTAKRRVFESVFTACLVVLAPATTWWSFWTLEAIWPCLVGGMTVVVIARQRANSEPGKLTNKPNWSSQFCLAFVGAVALARLPFIYQPWSIPTFLLIAAVTVDLLRSDGVLRHAVRPFIMVSVTAVLAALTWYLLNRHQYQVLAQTVYPGGRRSQGGGLGVPIFSGVFDFAFSRDEGGSITGINLSEASLGWMIVPIVAVLLWVFQRMSSATPLYTTVGRWGYTIWTTVILVVWGIAQWPMVIARVNPLQLIPGARMTQILSVVLLIPALLMIFRIADCLDLERKKFVAITSMIITFLLCVEAGTSLKVNLPALTAGKVWIVSVIVAAGVWVLIAHAGKIRSIVPLTLFATWSTVLVNPLVVGLGDLVDSNSAGRVATQVRGAPELRRVGTDDVFVDALIAANGLPQMSGQQHWGPNREAYYKIDPQGKFEGQWNQGASYLRFSWNPALGEEVSVSASLDQIVINISPCNQGLQDLGLGWVISSVPLVADCLGEAVLFTWLDVDRYLYSIET